MRTCKIKGGDGQGGGEDQKRKRERWIRLIKRYLNRLCVYQFDAKDICFRFWQLLTPSLLPMIQFLSERVQFDQMSSNKKGPYLGVVNRGLKMS